MKITLNELKLLVRKEIRRTLKENVDPVKIEEFQAAYRKNVLDELAEKFEGTPGYIEIRSDEFIEEFAETHNLKVKNKTENDILDRESYGYGDMEGAMERGETFVGDIVVGTYSAHTEGEDFTFTPAANLGDLYPFNANTTTTTESRKYNKRTGYALQEVMNFLFESCEEDNYEKSDEYLDKNFHEDLKNKLEEIFINKPGNNSWDGDVRAVQVQLSDFLLNIAKEHKLRFPGGTKLNNIITFYTESKNIEYHTEFTHNIEMEEKTIAEWTTTTNRGGDNHQFSDYKINEENLKQVSPPFLRFESPDGAYWNFDVIDPCSEEGEEKLTSF